MSIYTPMNTAIRALAETEEAQNSVGLVSMLDSLLPSFDMTAELQNPKTSFQAIRAFDRTNNFVCPELPTCAGLVDMSFYCANGIENDINIKTVDLCDKPYTFSFKEDTTMAQDVPVNGVFADQSGSVVSGIRKECMTINPQFRYTYYKTDARMCQNNAPCGSLVDDLVGDTTKKQVKKFRQVVLATANSIAVTVTGTGDMINKLVIGFNALADLPDNQGKEIIGYSNIAVIRRIKQLRDVNGRFIVDSTETCPVTGCVTICFSGMTLKSIESEFAPIIGTTTKTTDVLFVSVKNIFGVKSATKTAEVAWDKILTTMEDTIMSLQANNAKVPTILAGSTATKVTITL
jgi:hypothetical protein